VKFVESTRKAACAIGFLLLGIGVPSCSAQAHCDHSTYAYEDRVVVLGCDKAGAPELQVVLLGDASSLKITGRVKVDVVRGFDAAAHYKSYFMMAVWDKFFAFDLADPAHPKLAATFDLKKREQVPGYDRFEQIAENKFLALTAMGALEITTDGEPAKWNLAEIPLTLELKKKASVQPPEWQFIYQNQPAIVLKESAKFRYELAWQEKSTGPGEIWHRQYVHKVDLATKKNASAILLGDHLETID
jgi:hypothetical protein